jgi:hypothetical protein
MKERELVDALTAIIETLDKIVGELNANLGREAVDTIKEPLAKAHEAVADLKSGA